MHDDRQSLNQPLKGTSNVERTTPAHAKHSGITASRYLLLELENLLDHDMVFPSFKVLRLFSFRPMIHWHSPPNFVHLSMHQLNSVRGTSRVVACPHCIPEKASQLKQAEDVSQQVLELGRRLRRYGVSHNDIHLGNVVLRSHDNLPVLIDWGFADCELADRPLNERWTDCSMVQDYNLDIRYMLAVPIEHEGTEEEVVHTEMSAGSVWHRYRTPLSDDEQCRRAKEVGKYGWCYVNGEIESLSADARDKFYDEDTTVDPNQGLRWRVKKGLKTSLHDDPVPVQ